MCNKNLKNAYPWFFPLTYLFHMAEEYWGGVGFAQWASEIAGISFTSLEFLSLNIAFLFIMTGIVFLVTKNSSFRWILVALGTLVLVNGLLHTIMSILTGTYSPGVLSGLVFWIPLGWFTLRKLKSELKPMKYGIGIAVGLGIHLVATLIALSMG